MLYIRLIEKKNSVLRIFKNRKLRQINIIILIISPIFVYNTGKNYLLISIIYFSSQFVSYLITHNESSQM